MSCWLQVYLLSCKVLDHADYSEMPIMRKFSIPLVYFCALFAFTIAESNFTNPLSSHQILPDFFKPPQVFKNANLMRHINLEKGFVRETVNVVIENIDTQPQDEYFIPFKAEAIASVGALEVRDKKDPEKPVFRAEVVEYDPYRYVYQPHPSSMHAFLINVTALHNSIELLSLLP